MAQVSAWGFNEGSGSTAADSVDSRPLSGSTWAASAKNGAGCGGQFTAGSGIGPSATTAALTIMAWVKLAAPAASEYRGICASTVADRWFEYTVSSGAILLDYYGGGGGGGTTTANTTFAANTATHVAVVHNGTAVTLYINGSAAGTGSGASTTNLTAADWSVGGGHGDNNIAAGDWIDELRVFDSAENAASITTWMNTAIGGGAAAPSRPVIVTQPAIRRAAYI